MIKYTFFLATIALLAFVRPANAQQTVPAPFTGATAKLKHYDALYILNSSDEKSSRAPYATLIMP
jgi:hypothetical protein